MIVLNTAMAAQLTDFKTEVDFKIDCGKSVNQAIFEVLKCYIKTSKPIRFEGNGYSDEWKEEAMRRGLDCEDSVPKIFMSYTSAESVKIFKDIIVT